MLLHLVNDDVKVHRTSRVLFMECEHPENSVSFYRDGIGQSYRDAAYLVEYDSSGFMYSYDTVYYIPQYRMVDTLGRFEYARDTFIRHMDAKHQNMVRLKSKTLKKQSNKDFRKLDMNKYFDGYLYYAAFKVDFEYVDVGIIDIYMPPIPRTKWEQVFPVFERKIVRVLSLEPYCTEYPYKLR